VDRTEAQGKRNRCCQAEASIAGDLEGEPFTRKRRFVKGKGDGPDAGGKSWVP